MMKILTDVIVPDGLVDTILKALGLNAVDIDVTSPLGITLIIIACVVVLAIVFFILKSFVGLCRSGRY
jgi:uncharacterized protein HemY